MGIERDEGRVPTPTGTPAASQVPNEASRANEHTHRPDVRRVHSDAVRSNVQSDAPSSCSEARGHVLHALRDAPADVRDVAALLTSELVANALLHAAGPLTLTVSRDGPCIRVEVGDTGTMPPGVKRYGLASRTGRGLRMLEEMAEEWGWYPTPSGKTVWFELSTDRGWAPGGGHGMRRPSEPIAVDPYPAGVSVVLRHAPVEAMIRSGECYDALYREIRSRADDQSLFGEMEAPGRLLRLLEHLGTTFRGFGREAEEVWEQAVHEDRRYVDVSLHLPREAGPIVERYGRVLDEVEEYCREFLPHLEPTKEFRAVRRWAFEEVIRQCGGEAPRPWREEG